jgi:hypothetical protein
MGSEGRANMARPSPSDDAAAANWVALGVEQLVLEAASVAHRTDATHAAGVAPSKARTRRLTVRLVPSSNWSIQQSAAISLAIQRGFTMRLRGGGCGTSKPAVNIPPLLGSPGIIRPQSQQGAGDTSLSDETSQLVREMRALLSPAIRTLSSFDDPLIMALESRGIRFLRVSWLQRQGADFRILKRQDLEELENLSLNLNLNLNPNPNPNLNLNLRQYLEELEKRVLEKGAESPFL